MLVPPCLSAFEVSARPIRLETLYSETANLAYGLDAITGSLSRVDPATQRPLWEARFIRTDADRSALARWGAIKVKYARPLPLSGPLMPLLSRNDALSIGDAIETAELRSRSLGELADRLSNFLPSGDVEALVAVARRFQPPYHRWWKEYAERQGQPFARATRRMFSEPGLIAELTRFQTFYNAALPENAVGRFSLILRTDKDGGTNGQQLEGTAAVEFRPDERPEDRIGTLVHEFCHFLYRSRTPASDVALQARFVASGDPTAKPALNLMNETLATALGNGLVGRRYAEAERWARRMRTPRSLYNDDAIDRAAKRLLPTLDAFMASGGSMDDPGFAADYLGAIGAEFGNELLRPSGMLKEAFVLTEERFGKGFSRQAVRAMHIAGAYREETPIVGPDALTDFVAQPNLSALFVVSPARLGELVAQGVIDRGDAETLKTTLGKTGSAVLGRARTRFASTYVVVSEDADGAIESVKRLESRTGPLVGVLP